MIKLGPVTKKDLPPGPLADGVFGLPDGIGPTPIKSPLGWHIVRINSIEPGKARRSTRSRRSSRRSCKAQLAPDLLIKLVTDFERCWQDAVDEGRGRGSRLKIKTYENVDARGQDADGQAGRDRPGRQRAGAGRLRHARERGERASGDASAASTSSSAPTASRPARIPALTEVEAKVTEAWQAEERRKLADAKVKAALEKANAGTDFEALAKELGLEMRTAKPVTRFEADQGNYLTQPVVQELFKLQAGKTQSVRTAEGSVLVRLEADRAGRPRQGQGRDRPLRQAARLDGRQRPDPAADRRACAPSTAWSVDEAAFVAAFRPQNQP